MKDNYSPWPTLSSSTSNSADYDMHEFYVYKFYHDKDFHIKRLDNGEKQIDYAKKEAALYSALAGVLAIGTLVHGADLINPSLLRTGLATNITSILVSAGAAAGIAKSVIYDRVKFISHAKQDIGVSEEMLERFEKETLDDVRNPRR